MKRHPGPLQTGSGVGIAARRRRAFQSQVLAESGGENGSGTGQYPPWTRRSAEFTGAVVTADFERCTYRLIHTALCRAQYCTIYKQEQTKTYTKLTQKTQGGSTCADFKLSPNGSPRDDRNVHHKRWVLQPQLLDERTKENAKGWQAQTITVVLLR